MSRPPYFAMAPHVAGVRCFATEAERDAWTARHGGFPVRHHPEPVTRPPAQV